MADVPITVTIPDTSVSRAVAGLCGQFRYEQNKLEGETQNQFALRMAKRLMLNALKSTVITYEDRQSRPEDLPLT